MNTKNLNLDIKGDGSVRFSVDAAQLEKLKDVSEFTPKVTRISPVNNLTTFFGIGQSI